MRARRIAHANPAARAHGRPTVVVGSTRTQRIPPLALARGLAVLERLVAGRVRAACCAAGRRREWSDAVNKAAFELGWEGVAEVPLATGEAVLREAASRLAIVGVRVSIELGPEAGIWRALIVSGCGRPTEAADPGRLVL